jgi:negative regulator of flagellin synthesis FlgM
MVDSINSSNSAAVAANKSAKASAQQVNREPSTSVASGEAAVSIEVTLSNEIRAGEETAAFDDARVQEMRQAIESGNFPLDARRIAENFAELERLI